MKKSREFWNKEHERGPGFQELASQKPSIAVVRFLDYLKNHDISLRGKLLDVGCGTGRNANWLAQQGFDVTGVDVSDVAIKEAARRAQTLGLSVNYQELDVSAQWPFEDDSINYIVDTVTSQLLTLEELRSYRDSLQRVLKPEGRFLLWTLDRTVDKEAQRLIKECPGPEENTYIIPEISLVERTFTLEEITQLCSPLKIESQELVYYPSQFENKTYERYFWWVLLKK